MGRLAYGRVRGGKGRVSRLLRACQLCRVAVPGIIGRGGANIVAKVGAMVVLPRLGLRLVRVSLFPFSLRSPRWICEGG
jgi:hypothetical protein